MSLTIFPAAAVKEAASGANINTISSVCSFSDIKIATTTTKNVITTLMGRVIFIKANIYY